MRTAVLLLVSNIAFFGAGEQVRISGTVVHGISHQKLSGAHVYLTSGKSDQAFSLVTRGDGRFEFIVPTGKYSLTAEALQMPRQNFGGRTAPPEIAVSIIAQPGLPLEDLTFPLFPSGSIHGKIVDNFGDPAENGLVHLMRKTVSNGKARIMNYRWAYTNDLGEYRFGQVPAGTYYVAVNAKPWYSEGNRRVRSDLPDQTSSSEAFLPSYFPGSPNVSEAAPIAQAPGQDTRADFTLIAVRGAMIEVTCKDCPGRGSLELIYDGVGHVEEFQQTISISNGQGVLSSVPPGQYFVRVLPDQSLNARAAMAKVNVQGANLAVELNATGMPSVSGVVEMLDGVAVPHNAIIRVINLNSARIFTSTVEPGGKFSIDGVIPGPYEILVLGTTGVYTKKVSIGDRESRVLEVSEQGVNNVRVQAGLGGGSVAGSVQRDGKPVYGVLAVLAPEGLPNEPDRYHSFMTDSDGSFQWSNLPPGSYRLFAVDKYQFEYKAPNTLLPFMKEAKLIEIGPGDLFREVVSVIE